MRWTDPVDGRPLRHARVWLDRSSWRSSIVRIAADDADVFAEWIAAGRALVACRREPSPADGCALGLALPDRRRLSLVVDARAVRRIAPPLRLDEVVDAAPTQRKSALTNLIERGHEVSAHFHVYGSFAWQAISGQSYVTACSDLDLLWSATSLGQVDRVAAALLAWEAEGGLRADGELLLDDGDGGDGGGVAWRELIARPDRVLVKRLDGVSLQPLAALFPASFERCRSPAPGGKALSSAVDRHRQGEGRHRP